VSDKAIIVSLRFNPAFIQTLIAYAKAFSSLGIISEFLVDQAYLSFPELTNLAKAVEFRGLPIPGQWRHAVFVNPSMDNRVVATELKGCGTRILYIYHEPWQMSLDYLQSEGVLATIRAFFAHRATIPVLRLADQVLLPSQTALKQYRKAEANENSNGAYLPLIFDDDARMDSSTLLAEKQYFSFIGKPCRSHGFDQFVRTMRHAMDEDPSARFLIASRFPLPGFVKRDDLIRSRQLEIVCGRPLTNEEMNRCYRESYCVWNIYRRSTQSGVLPKAFMFGTPVVASRVGSFTEFVEDGVNGRFAKADDPKGVWTAVKEVRQNLHHYAENCRKTFCKTFYFESWLPHLARMLRPE